MTLRTLVLVLFGVALGCSDAEEHQHGGDAASLGADAAALPDASSGSDGATVAAPVLVSASLVVHGTMALTWQNPAATCATILVNRRKDQGVYVVAQTLAGTTTSAEDMPGHDNGTYCYTITCVLGGQASAPSNERCVTQ
ncbi:MAG: hypothetical protein IT370_14585 [Deltaproteobacteria bacterium]|nr:hypothetical protein [Deltaproteobacteria bacterium]